MIMNKEYVTKEEFVLFKTMIEENLFKTDKKPYELAELMIGGFERTDKKIDYLTELMIGGFDRADKRLEEQTEIMLKQFDHLEMKMGSKMDKGFGMVKSDLELIKKHLGILA
jgi:hypothetical protein